MEVATVEGLPVLSDETGRIQYPNPPIEEGLCQLTFAEPLAWNVATPGLLFEALRSDYPQIPEGQEQIAASMEIEGGGPSFSLNRGLLRYVYKDTTGVRLVVASPTTFSVNSLRPYEGWPSLRARLEAALGCLRSVVEIKPVAQVSLRYVNRIVIPLSVVNTDDYFDLSVHTAEQARATYVGFLHRVESVLTDDVTRVTSTFASLESPPSETHFLLDLDFRRPGLSTADLSEVLVIADDLKVKENLEFESCITERARELFR